MDINFLRERETDGVFTVSELNNYIKNLFEGNRTLSAVTVKGEISNFTNHRSGHLYFSLKDGDGQIKAVMFRSRTSSLKFLPESGMKVIAHGSVSVFTRDGSYQLYVNSLQPDGIGALYLAYEQLKQRLSEEGIFDESHKKPIPRIPESIGVITSPTGAAVRDIINVATRRFPLAKIYLYPALVQGDGAEQTLIDALDYFENSKLCDTIIIGRGGGSIEDLWAFNSERLARKIYGMSVPVISAVGHETDFTICDFVVDLRAPTPSAAAELAVPDMRELLLIIDGFSDRAKSALIRKVERARETLERLKRSATPTALLSSLDLKRKEVSHLYDVAKSSLRARLDLMRSNLAVCAGKLNTLSPLSVLERGYSIVERDGKVVSTITALSPGDRALIKLNDGSAYADIVEVKGKQK